MTRLTNEAVTEELNRRLYREAGEPEEGLGCTLTLTHYQPKSMSGHQRYSKHFHLEERWYGWAIGLNTAFGSNAIAVATDPHFVPNGLGTPS